MLAGDLLPVGGAAWDDEGGEASLRGGTHGYDRLTLEDILSAWAKDGKAFGRVDRHFTPYVEAILKHGQDVTAADKEDLRELSEIWAMARERLVS